MKIKAYYTTKKQRDELLYDLGWWDHFDTYGADITWNDMYSAKPTPYILVEGHACCEDMVMKLKKICNCVEVERWSMI